jgi:tRNA(fMet)-specific endonuclease VapC
MTAPQHERGILDTNAVIRLGEVDPLQLAVESLITTVTLAELSVGPLLTSDPQEAASRQRHLQQAETDFGEPLPFDAEAARTFGPIAGSLRNSGQKTRARAFDAIIASIAISRALPIYTFNPADFTATGAQIVDLTKAQ